MPKLADIFGDDLFENNLLKHLLRGKYTWAEMKPGSSWPHELTGKDLEKWTAELLEQHKENEDFARKLRYTLGTDFPLPYLAVAGDNGTARRPEASFVYMDVGAWIGSDNGAWGGDDGGTGRNLKRDFGVVCGPLVLLCSYKPVYLGEDCAEWTRMRGSGVEPWASVARLIDALSKPGPLERSTSGSRPLEKVVVRGAIMASGTNPRWPSDPHDYVIQIFVGDMHAAALDEEIQTYADEAIRDDKVVDPKHLAEVERRGRIDLAAVEALVKTLVYKDGTALDSLVAVLGYFKGQSYDGAAGKMEWLGRKITGGVAGLSTALGTLLVGVGAAGRGALNRDFSSRAKEKMQTKQARDWHQYYRGGSDVESVKNAKPADISECAGEHFLHFVDRLVAYSKPAAGHTPRPVRFIQLGDMFDFWIGFTCHYKAAPNHNQAITNVTEIGQDLVKWWVSNTLDHTIQGQMVAEGLRHLKTSGLEQWYLYGNHDNYLGAVTEVQHGREGQPKETLAPRQPSYERLGVFAEHGHQWDMFNSDAAKTDDRAGKIWGTYMGTPSPTSLVLTQAAFIRPERVRLFEGKAQGALAKTAGTLGQRLEQIIGAGFRFLEESGGFYCYVMGHTHHAVLTEVVLDTRHVETGDRRARRLAGNPDMRIHFLEAGKESRKDILIRAPKDAVDHQATVKDHRATVKVEWQKMPGDPEAEWLALEDAILSPKPDFEQAVSGLARANDGSPSGVAVFEDVPSGAYLARYYLQKKGQPGREPSSLFRKTATRVLVEGMSFHGDASQSSRHVIEIGKDKRGAPTIEERGATLRWAFDRRGFEEAAAAARPGPLVRPDTSPPWFGLYRPDEPDSKLKAPLDQANQLVRIRRPTRHFGALNPSEPWVGQASLKDALLELALDAADVEGAWEIRAFLDLAGEKRLWVLPFKILRVAAAPEAE